MSNEGLGPGLQKQSDSAIKDKKTSIQQAPSFLPFHDDPSSRITYRLLN